MATSSVKARFDATAASRSAEGQSDSDVRRVLDAALRNEDGYMGIDAVYPDEKQVVYYVSTRDMWKMKRRSYSMAKDGTASLKDDAVEVEPQVTYEPVAAEATPAPIPAPVVSGGNKLPKTAAAITPPSKAANAPSLKTANCGCKGDTVMTRAELIASLVTDKHSGFKDGDEAILETASDARLEEFRSAADANKAAGNTITKLETDNRNTSARLKVAEDRLKTAESPLSEEEFALRAPAGIKALLDQRKAEEDGLRAALISQLKDLGANTEDELKAKSTSDLQTLAAYARVEVPDFSGRGLPKSRFTPNSEDYTPPDSYAEGLKALRAKIN